MINLEKYYPYKCECCGLCCKYVNLIPEMSSFNRGDGVCKYLNKYNKCNIYIKRPDICNGEKVYTKFFSHMSVKDFHKLVHQGCLNLRRINFEK